MRIIFYILTFLIFTQVSVANHADKLVQEGVKSYQSKDYISALKTLNQAIEDKTLHRNSIPKAYYYRGVTYVALAKTNKILSEPYLSAFNDLKMAKLQDGSKKEWDGIASEKLNELEPYLVKRALFLYKTGVSGNSDRINQSKLYFEALSTLALDDYVYDDYIGQCNLLLKDTSEAINFFVKAQTKALERKDGVPDFSMGYSFYRLAKVYGLNLLEHEKGLGVLDKAREYLKNELKELEKTKLMFTVEQYQVLQQEELDLTKLYDRLELEFSSSGESGYHKAVKQFEKALDVNAKDAPVLIAYASFIEEKEPEKAEELYRQVMEIDSQNFSAYYGIGALYVEQGGDYLNKAHEAKTNENIVKLNALGKDKYRSAIPFFEKAYKLNPKENILLQTIIQLSAAVGDKDVLEKYSKIGK